MSVGSPMSVADDPEPILLPQLPDESLLMIMELLPPAALAHLGAACRALQTVAIDEKLWATHCARHKVKADASTTARARFGRFAATMCVECRAPTPYHFVLTGERLCSACELGHPQRYALATEGQLLEARSDALRRLGAAARRALLGALPSLELKGFTFYRRHDALTRAEALLAEEEPARKSSRLADDDDEEAGEEAGGEEAAAGEAAAERDDGESGDDAGDVAAAWEAAAKEHEERRSAKNAARSDRRAAQKEERKENKRRVKEEQRARRESGGAAAGLAATATPEPKRSYHAKASSSGRSTKYASARQHRVAAKALGPSAFDEEFARLEDAFGEGCAGLSGLALSDT